MWILLTAWDTKQTVVTTSGAHRRATISRETETHLPAGASPHQLVRLPGSLDLPLSSLPPGAPPAASCLQWLPPATEPTSQSWDFAYLMAPNEICRDDYEWWKDKNKVAIIANHKLHWGTKERTLAAFMTNIQKLHASTWYLLFSFNWALIYSFLWKQ